MVVPLVHSSPYTEGLFQFLTLFVHGLKPEDMRLRLIVAMGSLGAFTIWHQALPAHLCEQVTLNSLPIELSSIRSEDIDFSPYQEWVRLCEEHIDCWFSLMPDLSVISAFKRPTISLFADYVFADFPTLFVGYPVQETYDACRRLNSYISKYVCFSEYVKRHHIMRIFGINEDRIEVIPHAYFSYPAVTGTTFRSRQEAGEQIREFCRSNGAPYRDEWQQRTLGQTLKEFAFEDVPYVFMSTRARPHKNAITVVRALELLLRSYTDIKLAVTAEVFWSLPRDEFSSLIIERGLQWDVIPMNRLPPHVHAALYKCAAVTVHPSPFEGGFPFTAFESLSSGTPVLLADGPVVREFLSPEVRKDFVFNPTSANDLAVRISEVLAVRNELVERQQKALEHHFTRTLEMNSSQILELARGAALEGAAAIPIASIGRYHLGKGATGKLEFFDRGWWQAESWGRWARDQKATIQFRYKETVISGFELKLRAPPFKGPQLFTGKIRVGGKTVNSVAVRGEGSCSVRVPSLKSNNSAITEVEVISNALARPCDNADRSSDDRELGFGVTEIEFF